MLQKLYGTVKSRNIQELAMLFPINCAAMIINQIYLKIFFDR